ncbi:hypothetical protein B0H10DRAFT_1741632, partial [Mycena sp. CBHHK59/15]
NSLCLLLAYNSILTSTIDILFDRNFDLCVLHVEGAKNEVADAISCQEFDNARSLVPNLVLHPFIPPQAALGA